MKWTEEKIKTFWMMKDSGSTLVEIAKELGCTKSAISQKAAELRNKAKKEKENAKMAECNEPETAKKFDDFFADADKKVWYAAGGGKKYDTPADTPTETVAPTDTPTTRAEILDAAKAIVTGEREKQYGSPEDNFGVIARLWSTYAGHSFTPVDVAVMMALLKVARIKTGHYKTDSYVDACGYLACAAEIAGR